MKKKAKKEWVRCVRCALYEGDVTYIDIDQQTKLMVLASLGVQPHLVFQTYQVFENFTPNNKIEITFWISETVTRTIEGKFDTLNGLIISIEDGEEIKELPWFRPINEEDNKWLSENLREERNYCVKKNGDLKYQIKFINPRAHRYYKSDVLPTLKEKPLEELESRQAILKMLYSEINKNWRELVGIRFILLGLIPLVSLGAWIGLFSINISATEVLPTTGLFSILPPIKLIQSSIIVVGFIMTTALFVYEKRNTELHDDLISRARKIEEELGIDTGQFRGRKTPSTSKKLFRIIRIQHDIAIKAIYWMALLGWVVMFLLIWLI
ncbi:MAG: hypothetical protein ACFFBD_25870 [Candidatus Hodarchaeota archaeon]